MLIATHNMNVLDRMNSTTSILLLIGLKTDFRITLQNTKLNRGLPLLCGTLTYCMYSVRCPMCKWKMCTTYNQQDPSSEDHDYDNLLLSYLVCKLNNLTKESKMEMGQLRKFHGNPPMVVPKGQGSH